MKFLELSSIGFPAFETKNSILWLKNEFCIDAPAPVIEQFYIDHSDKYLFQEQNGEIDLEKIERELVELPTDEILSLGNAATHPDFIVEVSEDAPTFDEVGDDAIDCRKKVSAHWKRFGTWFTPPIFLKGEVLGKPELNIHLVEGHTRLGCLFGISKYKLIIFC